MRTSIPKFSVKTPATLAVALTLALGLGACKKDDDAAPQAQVEAPAPAPAPAPPAGAPPRLIAAPAGEMRVVARKVA